jgi:hypothetical protein
MGEKRRCFWRSKTVLQSSLEIGILDNLKQTWRKSAEKIESRMR